MAVLGSLARRRLTWHACLDMPVGLTLPRAAGPGTTCQIHLAEAGLRHPGPYEYGAEQGWIVLLAITNPGHATVRSADFSAPLTFTFPGRQVHATQVFRESPAGHRRRRICIPVARVPPAPGPNPSHAGRLHLTGEYALRPADSYTIFLLLSGMPPAHTRPIWQDGTLPGGMIIPG